MRIAEVVKALKEKQDSLENSIKQREIELKKLDINKQILSEEIFSLKESLKNSSEFQNRQLEEFSLQKESSINNLEKLEKEIALRKQEIEKHNAELTKIIEFSKLNEKETKEKIKDILPELTKLKELGFVRPEGLESALLFADQSADLHKLPYSERLKHLNEMKETEHIKIPLRTLCSDEQEVRKAIEKYASEDGSEGAMIKLSDFVYELDRDIKDNIKFKNELSVDAVVLKANKVSGSENTFYYHCGISSPKGIAYTGRTFNTNIKADQGDIIKVAFVDISEYHDAKTGKVWFNWWAPHVIMKRTDKTSPDNSETLHRMVVQTTGRIEQKAEPKIVEDSKEFSEGVRIKILGTLGMGTKPTFTNKKPSGIMIFYKDKRILMNCGDASFLDERPTHIFLTDSNLNSVEGLEKGVHTPVYLTKEILKDIRDYPMEDIKIIVSDKTYKLDDIEIKTFGENPLGFSIKLGNFKLSFIPKLVKIGESINDSEVIESFYSKVI